MASQKKSSSQKPASSDLYVDEIPGEFAFQCLKAMAWGALAGVGAMCVNKAIQEPAALFNQQYKQLPFPAESMEHHPELCALFVQLKQYREYDEKAYDRALSLTSDIAFLDRKLQQGYLNKFIKDIELGLVDPKKDFDLDEDADTQYLMLDQSLQTLYKAVCRKEVDLYVSRAKARRQYEAAKKQFERDKLNYEEQEAKQRKQLRNQNQGSDSLDDLFDDNPKSKKQQVPLPVQQLPPKPIAPQPPAIIDTKLLCDDVEQYMTAIEVATGKIVTQIKDKVKLFRENHPGPA